MEAPANPLPDLTAAPDAVHPPTSAVQEEAPALPRSVISPRICEAFCALLLVLLALAPNSLLNSDGDPAHHIAVGRVFLATGVLPLVDVFSHAHFGVPFVNWEWVPQVGMALADRLLGLNGVA